MPTLTNGAAAARLAYLLSTNASPEAVARATAVLGDEGFALAVDRARRNGAGSIHAERLRAALGATGHFIASVTFRRRPDGEGRTMCQGELSLYSAGPVPDLDAGRLDARKLKGPFTLIETTPEATQHVVHVLEARTLPGLLRMALEAEERGGIFASSKLVRALFVEAEVDGVTRPRRERVGAV